MLLGWQISLQIQCNTNQNPNSLFGGRNWKANAKIHMEIGNQNNQNIFEKEQCWSTYYYLLLNTYCKVYSLTVKLKSSGHWHWCEHRQIDQWNRIGSTEISTHIIIGRYHIWISNIQHRYRGSLGEKEESFQQMMLKTCRTTWIHTSDHIQNINSKQIQT